MEKLYERIDFRNNTTPALNEDNLNAISKALDELDDRVIKFAPQLVLLQLENTRKSLEEARKLCEEALESKKNSRESELKAKASEENAARSAAQAQSCLEETSIKLDTIIEKAELNIKERAEQLVEQAYEIIKNSGNMSDVLEIREYDSKTYIEQDDSSNNDILGIAKNGNDYYTVNGTGIIKKYGAQGQVTEIDTFDTVHDYLCRIIRSGENVDVDKAGVHVVSYKENIGTEQLVYIVYAFDEIKRYEVTTENSNTINSSRVKDILPCGPGSYLLLEDGRILTIELNYYSGMIENVRQVAQGKNFKSFACDEYRSTMVACGEGFICRLRDASYESETTYNLTFNKVVYGNNCFIAFGEDGSVHRSEGGTQWVHVSNIPDMQPDVVTDAVYTGKEFVALVGEGRLYVSENDGGSWRKISIQEAEYKCLSGLGDGNAMIGSVKDSLILMEGVTQTLSLSGTVKELYYDMEERKNKVFFLTHTFPDSRGQALTQVFNDERLLPGKYHYSISSSQSHVEYNAVTSASGKFILSLSEQPEVNMIVRIELL